MVRQYLNAALEAGAACRQLSRGDERWCERKNKEMRNSTIAPGAYYSHEAQQSSKANLASSEVRTRTREQISEQMRRIRKIDTKPELLVRRLAHRLGYRYRLHRRDLPGTPDLVFPSRRKVVLVHGCFWHQHQCVLGSKQPRANAHYWLPKLARNKARDLATQSALEECGWSVLVVWECEARNESILSERLRAFLR